MKTIFCCMLLFSFNSFAALRVECNTSLHKVSIVALTASDIKVTLKGETVLADGILLNGEVDLVARFKTMGEMTLFAKIGKPASENYLFIQVKRFSVICL